jgi:hypothetical protein
MLAGAVPCERTARRCRVCTIEVVMKQYIHPMSEPYFVSCNPDQL